MIESEKGWQTEYILGLPLCRVRQLLELIQQEKRDYAKFQTQLVEWQTKQIASMFTVAARDNSQANSIVQAVKKMTLPLADEEADVKNIDQRELVDAEGEMRATTYDTEEDYALVSFDENSQPSFEALSAFFSGGEWGRDDNTE